MTQNWTAHNVLFSCEHRTPATWWVTKLLRNLHPVLLLARSIFGAQDSKQNAIRIQLHPRRLNRVHKCDGDSAVPEVAHVKDDGGPNVQSIACSSSFVRSSLGLQRCSTLTSMMCKRRCLSSIRFSLRVLDGRTDDIRVRAKGWSRGIQRRWSSPACLPGPGLPRSKRWNLGLCLPDCLPACRDLRLR